MVLRVFLDANVLLDFLLKRNGFEAARQLMERLVDARLTAFTTPSVIQMAGYWLTKAYGAEKAKMLLLSLLENIQIIDIRHDDCLHALLSEFEDIEDAIQYLTAIHHKMHYFISGDKAFQKKAIPSLPILDVNQFLSLTP